MSSKPLLVTQRRTFGPFNRCIYCGETTGLSDEHIIPEALSGKWELLKASCEKHRDITHRIEGFIGREMFLPIRHQHEFPSSHKDRPISLKVAAKLRGHEDEEFIDMNLGDIPIPIIIPTFE